MHCCATSSASLLRLSRVSGLSSFAGASGFCLLAKGRGGMIASSASSSAVCAASFSGTSSRSICRYSVHSSPNVGAMTWTLKSMPAVGGDASKPLRTCAAFPWPRCKIFTKGNVAFKDGGAARIPLKGLRCQLLSAEVQRHARSLQEALK